jgi:hypothetical protein
MEKSPAGYIERVQKGENLPSLSDIHALFFRITDISESEVTSLKEDEYGLVEYGIKFPSGNGYETEYCYVRSGSGEFGDPIECKIFILKHNIKSKRKNSRLFGELKEGKWCFYNPEIGDVR